MVAVAWYRQLDTLKLVGGQWKDVILVIDDVKRNAKIIGQRLAACQAAEAAQHWKRDIAVEPCQSAYLTQCRLAAIFLAIERVGITLSLDALQRQLHFVKREDVDEDAPVLETAVISTLVKERAGVAQLGEEIKIVLVRIIGLQDNV